MSDMHMPTLWVTCANKECRHGPLYPSMMFSMKLFKIKQPIPSADDGNVFLLCASEKLTHPVPVNTFGSN